VVVAAAEAVRLVAGLHLVGVEETRRREERVLCGENAQEWRRERNL
jgi:hypothetical protein